MKNEPIPRRRWRIAGSKLGQPRTIQERYPGISPAAVAVWEKMCQMDPPPPVVKAWRDWEARQKRAALALRQKQKEPPTARGSKATGDLPAEPREQQRRGDADHDDQQ